jgi:hypothetical protein
MERAKRMAFFLLLLLLFSTATCRCFARQYDTTSVFNMPIALDTYIVKSGFDVNAFIRRVKSDTTFYKAFRSMRLRGYTATNDIAAYDKHGLLTATDHSKTQQVFVKHCRSTKVLEEQTTGDYYKRNGDYNYYTSELLAYLFFTKVTICGENDIVAGAMNTYGSGSMEKRKYELKQLIFNPGSKISGIPFMSDRESIFDEDESQKYNFSIVQDQYEGQDCYVFKIVPKAGYERKVIYNELNTWFRKSDYSILARDYSLSYHTLVYDFDVVMKVRTREIDGKLYPVHIDYNGDWHVFTKNRERVKFTTDIQY